MIEGNPLCHINKPFLESLFQKKETYHTDWFSALGGAGIVLRLRLSWTSWVENKNHLGANAWWEVAVRMAHDHLISLYSSPRVIHSLYFMYWYDRFFSCPSHKGLVKSPGRCIGSLGAKWPIWDGGVAKTLRCAPALSCMGLSAGWEQWRRRVPSACCIQNLPGTGQCSREEVWDKKFYWSQVDALLYFCAFISCAQIVGLPKRRLRFCQSSSGLGREGW